MLQKSPFKKILEFRTYPENGVPIEPWIWKIKSCSTNANIFNVTSIKTYQIVCMSLVFITKLHLPTSKFNITTYSNYYNIKTIILLFEVLRQKYDIDNNNSVGK